MDCQPVCMQVQDLRWICLQYLLCNLDTGTVLKTVQLAEKLSDSILMEACVQLLTESDNRYSVVPCSDSASVVAMLRMLCHCAINHHGLVCVQG